MSAGIAGLDKMLGGRGVFRGANVLVSGSPDTIVHLVQAPPITDQRAGLNHHPLRSHLLPNTAIIPVFERFWGLKTDVKGGNLPCRNEKHPRHLGVCNQQVVGSNPSAGSPHIEGIAIRKASETNPRIIFVRLLLATSAAREPQSPPHGPEFKTAPKIALDLGEWMGLYSSMKKLFLLGVAGLLAVSARAANLPGGTFMKFEQECKASFDEPWRTIPWKISLLEAQKVAALEKKPIFIWAMDGHPLGCT